MLKLKKTKRDTYSKKGPHVYLMSCGANGTTCSVDIFM